VRNVSDWNHILKAVIGKEPAQNDRHHIDVKTALAEQTQSAMMIQEGRTYVTISTATSLAAASEKPFVSKLVCPLEHSYSIGRSVVTGTPAALAGDLCRVETP